MGDMDQEHVDLEVKMSFLERTVEGLNGVVLEQSRIVDQLWRKVEDLESRVKQGLGELGQDVGPQDEKPPHY
jgi:uncharacterized coiled-coil protein SlyX